MYWTRDNPIWSDRWVSVLFVLLHRPKQSESFEDEISAINRFVDKASILHFFNTDCLNHDARETILHQVDEEKEKYHKEDGIDVLSI